ncbi:uncharacterized protein LOC115880170 [Sitophilus oryzae]|uniref:Uncharacterized protein LOC115880170 n=1 Tax=Sitophilus oryzae TaxID=7048 RepID=A0A6J2XQ17_SITOR|nr:uncharacterized protein LOC115880170 [Sitophilus oryzae]
MANIQLENSIAFPLGTAGTRSGIEKRTPLGARRHHDSQLKERTGKNKKRRASQRKSVPDPATNRGVPTPPPPTAPAATVAAVRQAEASPETQPPPSSWKACRPPSFLIRRRSETARKICSNPVTRLYVLEPI